VKLPQCSVCKRPLVGARVVVNERWMCPDCVHEREYGPSPRKPRRGRRKPPQDETLFPAGRYRT
jgi:hypothetical protein